MLQLSIISGSLIPKLGSFFSSMLPLPVNPFLSRNPSHAALVQRKLQVACYFCNNLDNRCPTHLSGYHPQNTFEVFEKVRPRESVNDI